MKSQLLRYRGGDEIEATGSENHRVMLGLIPFAQSGIHLPINGCDMDAMSMMMMMQGLRRDKMSVPDSRTKWALKYYQLRMSNYTPKLLPYEASPASGSQPALCIHPSLRLLCTFLSTSICLMREHERSSKISKVS